MKAAPNFEYLLQEALQQLGLEYGKWQRKALLAYIDELQRWNRTYNLTAIKDPHQMLVQHVFDSLAVLPVLRQDLSANTKIVDVGSGAGLPGLVLAICEPEWQLYCIDAVQKKTAFMRQIVAVLKMENVEVMHGRVENIASLQANAVISRAFSSLEDFVRLASHHATDDGLLYAMKAKIPQQELAALSSQDHGWKPANIQSLTVPGLAAERCLIRIALLGGRDDAGDFT